MENKIEIPDIEGTIFKLGDDIFIANGSKSYSTFGSEEEFSRKDIRKIAKAQGLEATVLVANANSNALNIEGRVVESSFFVSTHTPFRWSSGESMSSLGANYQELGSLEEARDEALRREVCSYSEDAVVVGFGVKYSIRQNRSTNKL